MKLLIDRNEKIQHCPVCSSVFAYSEHDIHSGFVWYSVGCPACHYRIKIPSADLPKRWKREIARCKEIASREDWRYCGP